MSFNLLEIRSKFYKIHFDLVKLTEDATTLADEHDGDVLAMMEMSRAELCGYLNYLFAAQTKSAWKKY